MRCPDSIDLGEWPVKSSTFGPHPPLLMHISPIRSKMAQQQQYQPAVVHLIRDEDDDNDDELAVARTVASALVHANAAFESSEIAAFTNAALRLKNLGGSVIRVSR